MEVAKWKSTHIQGKIYASQYIPFFPFYPSVAIVCGLSDLISRPVTDTSISDYAPQNFQSPFHCLCEPINPPIEAVQVPRPDVNPRSPHILIEFINDVVPYKILCSAVILHS